MKKWEGEKGPTLSLAWGSQGLNPALHGPQESADHSLGNAVYTRATTVSRLLYAASASWGFAMTKDNNRL